MAGGFEWSDVAEDSREKYPHVGPETFERFENHHRAKGSTFVDWRRAWWTWASRERDYAPTRSQRLTRDETVMAWGELAASADRGEIEA